MRKRNEIEYPEAWTLPKSLLSQAGLRRQVP
jgi:hypothetical protein